MQDNSETNAATKEQVRQKTPKEIAESVPKSSKRP
jgi:hypothetical protein